MFKKQKINKDITPPKAPSLEEVLSDIETFQVDIDSCNFKVADSPVNSTEDWWKVFEQFMDDLKCLEMVNSEIEGFKIKLESLKLEIETDAQHLKNEIEQHQQLIAAALE